MCTERKYQTGLWPRYRKIGSIPRNISRILLTTMVGLLLFGADASAQGNPRIVAPGPPRSVGSSLDLYLGRSAALNTPWVIKRVSVANPATADVEVLDPTELLVVAKSVGNTDLIIWGEDDQVWSTVIRVEVDLDKINAELTRLFPRTGAAVARTSDTYFATGLMERAEQVRQLHDFLAVSNIKFVDMTELAGVPQVQLKVRIAEVNRVAIRNMGINALYTSNKFFGASLIGSAAGGVLNPISIGPPGGAIAGNNIPFVFTKDVGVSTFATLLAGFPGSDLEFFIQALAENQYLQLLAEPTLVALSGEEATFLAGGEFPIPVVQGSGAGGGTSITIEYKEFGIRLGFRPIVLGDGTIRLHIAPEVSNLSNIGAVEIEGFRIPSLLTRRASTTLELKSGQTFVMAGLLNESTNSRSSRVPILGDLPILGALFRSVSYQKGESELVVLVTATLVEPLSHATDRPLPGDLHIAPNDWELFLLGRLEGRHKEDAEDDDAASLRELKGPGAWVNHREMGIPTASLPRTAGAET